MTRAGNVYGEALFSLAREEQLEKALLDQLLVLQESFRQEPDFLRLLANRSVPKERRCTVLEESFRGRVHNYVLNFLKLLTEKGHSSSFLDCVSAYQNLYYEQQNILPVSVVTAVALSEGQKNRLTDKLADMTGKSILLTETVDPAVLGGIRLEYAGQELEDTVRRRLDDLRSLLTNTVL